MKKESSRGYSLWRRASRNRWYASMRVAGGKTVVASTGQSLDNDRDHVERMLGAAIVAELQRRAEGKQRKGVAIGSEQATFWQ